MPRHDFESAAHALQGHRLRWADKTGVGGSAHVTRGGPWSPTPYLLRYATHVTHLNLIGGEHVWFAWVERLANRLGLHISRHEHIAALDKTSGALDRSKQRQVTAPTRRAVSVNSRAT